MTETKIREIVREELAASRLYQVDGMGRGYRALMATLRQAGFHGSEHTVRKLGAAGKLPGVKTNGQGSPVVFNISQVQAWVKSLEG